MNPFENHEITIEVEAISEVLLENVIDHITDETSCDWEEVLDSLAEEEVDTANGDGLSLDDQLTAVEWYAENNDDTILEKVHWGSIRHLIESKVDDALHAMAIEQVRQSVLDLQVFCEKHDLDLENAREEDPFRAYGSTKTRFVDPHCDVFEYRGIEDGDVDVWAYSRDRLTVFFEKYVDEE